VNSVKPTGNILSVSADCDDHAALRGSLSGTPCELITADTCQAAVQMLNDSGISIVVCDTNLRDGTWRDILNSAPNATLVVSSKCPDEHLWAEVLNLGGFDVITKPFDKRELHHVLQTAYLVTKTERNITTDR
jgi:DNA-binding response OmpR family regulator